LPEKLPDLRALEASGTHGVGVKSVDIVRNTKSEGSWLGRPWRWLAKAWGAKRIRYPRSPRCKLWTLASGSVDPFTGEANALSVPPGKYGGNVETQRNRRGST